MPYAICPGCDDELYVRGEPRLGQKVLCRECDETLQVVSVDPLEVDWAYEDEEDDR